MQDWGELFPGPVGPGAAPPLQERDLGRVQGHLQEPAQPGEAVPGWQSHQGHRQANSDKYHTCHCPLHPTSTLKGIQHEISIPKLERRSSCVPKVFIKEQWHDFHDLRFALFQFTAFSGYWKFLRITKLLYLRNFSSSYSSLISDKDTSKLKC